MPLQVFNIRKSLNSIANSSEPESEKERLIEDKLREVIDIYQSVTEKIRNLTEKQGRLSLYDAKQMLNALQHLSAYLYSKFGSYKKIEKEAVKMVESAFSFDMWLEEGERRGKIIGEKRGKQDGRLEHAKETAYDMFLDGEKIEKIRKYSKLSDEDLMNVLKTLPEDVQSNYQL